MMKKCLIVLISLWYACFISFDSFTAAFLPTDKIFISKPEAKQKKLDQLLKQLDELTKDKKKKDEYLSDQLHQIKQEIIKVKQQLQDEPENEFLSKKLVLLNDRYQVLKDYRSTQEKLESLLKEFIQLLREYLDDPDLNAYRQEVSLANRIAFSFEDLRQVKERIDAKKASIDLLQQQESNTQREIKSREQAAAALAQQYKDKEEEQEKSENELLQDTFDINVQHERERINLEFALLGTRKEVDELQLTILRLRLKFIDEKIELEKQQLQILQEVFNRIKQSSISISEADVAFARDILKEKKQKLNAKKFDTYEPKKEQIKQTIDQKREELESLSKQFNLPITDELNEWFISPKKTAESYLGFLAVAKANESFVVEQLLLEELDAQIDLEDQSLVLERIETDIKSSFYKMYTGKFASEEKIFEEIKRYEVRLSDIKADLSQLEGKKTTIETQLTKAKKALDNIAAKRQEIIDQKEQAFKERLKDYTQALELLNASEELVKQQIKILNSIRSIYNDTALKLLKTEQQIKFTNEELRASLRSIIWDRPEDAISWQGVKNIIPNVETFVRDVHSYIVHFDIGSLLYKIKNLFKEEYSVIYFIWYAILWFILLTIIWLFLPRLRNALLAMIKRNNTLALFFATLLTFVLNYFVIIVLWLSLFLLLTYYVVPDPYPYIIFYLLSIPLLLYLAHRLISYVTSVNSKHDYIFVGREYQRRFNLCFSTLLYATIIIFFFREAFILANYPKSELPNILKALNIIILQISMIFLITKELVLSFIPRTNDIWIWLRDQVDHYYYLILAALIAIIVMMNPYVGFGRLVLFILSRVVYTFLLIGVLFWLHNLVKKWSSALFFHTEQEVVKERFHAAKTWYGVSIIAILFSFIFIGAIICAKIWQWPEQLTKIKEFQDIVQWLQLPISYVGVDETPISVYTFLKFLFFLFMGFVASFAIKRFVLSRIFDVLLVDSGVQNTVTSLMRYIIMLIAIMFGFSAVGLGPQINLILVSLLVGIGFIVKDPAADFFAYFILLVQRPIKIGDYIKIDDEATGVVRKITPRSVVLRRKNSTMIILPNSYVVNHAIINWNYIRGFIAFNDILVTIAYREDPIKVKELFERILDNSPFVLKNPKPIVRLDDFGLHGYEFMLRGFVSSNYTLDQWNIASDIRLQLVKVLREQNIQLALPIRVMVNYPKVSEHGQMPEAAPEQMEE